MSTQSPYTSRRFAGDPDLLAMEQLLIACRPAGRQSDFPNPQDLHEIVAQLPARYRIELWEEPAGAAVGFAIVDLIYDNIYFEIAPEARDSRIAAEMIAWAAERLASGPQGAEPELTLDTACREDDSWRLALLVQNGFLPLPVRTLTYARSLAEPVDVPHLPAGFTIRGAAGDHEVEALVALHRAAFGTDHMTLEERLSMMRVPGYENELDLVAVAPEGTLAGTCYCIIGHEEGSILGFTDPVATHPAYQRLGLARSLLLEGMRRLRARGAVTAMLGTSSDNAAMQGAAESAGYRVAWSKVWLSKPLKGATPSAPPGD
jgi:ribosomal protein S18 acetylase RimI-like enzyme